MISQGNYLNSYYILVFRSANKLMRVYVKFKKKETNSPETSNSTGNTNSETVHANRMGELKPTEINRR